ncbi:MAG: hypothetical protein ACJAR1_001131 [Rubritalea sp.]|jgi:hypothetical protein
MTRLRVSSITEQVVTHLRDGIRRGRWEGTMPGRIALAEELGASRKTVALALTRLEQEGILEPQGLGRARRIVPSEVEAKAKPMRVSILLYESIDARLHYVVDLKHQLQEAGHVVSIASKSLIELGMNVSSIARFVGKFETDVWVIASASRDVLRWFAEQPIPAFAFGGRHRTLSIAGAAPNKLPTYRAVVSRLVDLGHHRIVLIVREQHRLPSLGPMARIFLETRGDHDILVGPYNIPNWEDSPEGLLRCIDSLFATTPPTALIIDEVHLFHAVRIHLAHSAILAPQDVSLICTDSDPSFEWCRPTIACMRWDSRPFVQSVVRWAEKVSRGQDDRRKTNSKAEFVEGGTVGPVSKMTAR